VFIPNNAVPANRKLLAKQITLPPGYFVMLQKFIKNFRMLINGNSDILISIIVDISQ